MLKIRCQADVTIDGKGRLALPAPIRRALQERGDASLVLALCKGAVWGWTVEEYEARIEGPLLEADQFATDVIDFAHGLLSTAQDAELDAQGRIRVPPKLRALAGLDKNAVVHSVMNRLEIWDATAWDRRFEQALERTSQASGTPGRAP